MSFICYQFSTTPRRFCKAYLSNYSDPRRIDNYGDMWRIVGNTGEYDHITAYPVTHTPLLLFRVNYNIVTWAEEDNLGKAHAFLKLHGQDYMSKVDTIIHPFHNGTKYSCVWRSETPPRFNLTLPELRKVEEMFDSQLNVTTSTTVSTNIDPFHPPPGDDASKEAWLTALTHMVEVRWEIRSKP